MKCDSVLHTSYYILLSTSTIYAKIVDMLILYTKDNCGYCDKVKGAFIERGVIYEERNIKNPDFLKEVQAHHARTMPFLFDTTANVAMAESDDIIDYASEYAF